MNVGVIGLGSIARKHIAALREIDNNLNVIALRHSATSVIETGIENVFSYDDFLSQPLDFIIISNPTSEHLSTIKRLGNTQIPLFIEKPLFSGIGECPNIIQKSYVACNLRFLDSIIYVKENIKDKRVNEVNVYCGSYLPDWRPNINWRECYSANRAMGGGVHIDLIHEIDYVYWLFGRPHGVQKHFRSLSSLDIDSIDYANYILSYPQFTVSTILNYYRRDYKRTLVIVFDDDTWSVDLSKNKITNIHGDVIFESKQISTDTYKDQMQFFIENINSDSQFNNIEEAYEVLKICLDDETKR